MPENEKIGEQTLSPSREPGEVAAEQMGPSPAHRAAGLCCLPCLIYDLYNSHFVWGRPEGKVIPGLTNKAEKTKPGLHAQGGKWGCGPGWAAKAAAPPGTMGHGVGDGERPSARTCRVRPRLPLHPWDEPLPGREPGIALSKLPTQPDGDSLGCGLGGAQRRPHVSLGPDGGIKGSPGTAVYHSNLVKD